MRKMMWGIVAILASLSSANAADMLPVKALPKPTVLFTYAGSGLYFGLGTFAENDKLSSSGGLIDIGGAYQVGASINAVGGYMWGNGSTWAAVEAMAGYKNVGVETMAGPNTPAVFSSRYGFTERVKVGGPITALLSMLPSIAGQFPTLPSVALGSNVHPYLFAAAHQDPLRSSIGLAEGKAWIIKGGFGIGAMSQLSPRIVMDVWAEYVPAGGSLTLGLPAGIEKTSQGHESRVGASLLF